MMTKKWNYLYIVLLGFSLFTCQETIEFASPETIKDAIYIEGKLTKGNPSRVAVKIGLVFDFVTNPSLFSAEYVHLIDEAGNTLELKTQQQGIFELEIPENLPNFRVDYGNAYKIKLALKNGVLYESAFDTLYPVPTPSTLSLDRISKNVVFADGKTTTQEIVIFNISTPLIANQNKRPYLLWELESVYKQTDYPTGFGLRRCRPTGPPKTCYLTISPVDNYKVLDTRLLAGEAIRNHTIFEAGNTNTFVFAEGYYLTAYQQSISKSAFEYWSQVNQIVNPEGTVFSAPSGKITSNIRNADDPKDGVYGYFFATESKLIRAYVPPDYAGNPRGQCPAAGDMHSVFCDNCLCDPNSTTEKPEWWEE